MDFLTPRQATADSIRKGEHFIHLGEFARGVDYYTWLLEADPDNKRANVQSLVKRARCYDGLCCPEARDADFERILTLAPDGPEAQLVRGIQLRWEEGLRAEACDHFSAAIRLDPAFADAYENRGQLYYFNNQFRLAVRDFTACLRLVPPHANARYFRASAYLRLGDYQRAAQDLETFLELYPTTPMRERLCREIAACWFALAEMEAVNSPPPTRRQQVWKEIQARFQLDEVEFTG